MPQYLRAYCDPETGEVQHLVVSSAPLTVQAVDAGTACETEELVLDDHPDGWQRAAALRARLERRGGQVGFKDNVPGRDRQRITRGRGRA